MLINNAGVSSKVSALKDTTEKDWQAYQSQLNINLHAPIHLSILFLPHLQTKTNAAIINVTSVVAFFPFVTGPVYSATKAALHSFTISLRHQLKETSVQVIEIAPPSVRTDMNDLADAADLNEYADDTIAQLLEGKNTEIGYGPAAALLRADRDTLDAVTAQYATIGQ